MSQIPSPLTGLWLNPQNSGSGAVLAAEAAGSRRFDAGSRWFLFGSCLWNQTFPSLERAARFMVRLSAPRLLHATDHPSSVFMARFGFLFSILHGQRGVGWVRASCSPSPSLLPAL